MATTTTVYAFTKPAQGDTPWTTQANTDYDSIDAELARPRWPFNSPVMGATTTCDLSLARLFLFTVTQVTTLAFTNAPAATFGTRIVLRITNGNAFALTWPASVIWLSGVAPILKSSGVDLIELWTTDAGVTWYAGALDRPLSRLIGQVTTDVGTGAATVETTLHTIVVPANVLGPNGALRIRVHYSVTGVNNTKAVNIYYGAGQLLAGTFTAGQQATNGIVDAVMVNRNATGSQHVTASYSTANGAIQYLNATTTIDSTVSQSVFVKGLTTNAADEVTANVTLVELLRS